MGHILLIARREIAAYYTTWMGYIITAAYLVLSSALFHAMVSSNTPRYSADMLFDFFYYPGGVIIAAGIFLGMRLISEEHQLGTATLLFTSPITARQIIYGKFLSCFVIICFLLTLSLYMPALIYHHGKISFGHLAAGYLCLIFLGSIALSVTLFMSAVAPHPLVAAILGAMVISIMLMIWMLADKVDAPFNGLFSYMAVHNDHFSSYATGVVNLKSVIFHSSVIFLFLEFAVRVLDARRWRG